MCDIIIMYCIIPNKSPKIDNVHHKLIICIRRRYTIHAWGWWLQHKFIDCKLLEMMHLLLFTHFLFPTCQPTSWGRWSLNNSLETLCKQTYITMQTSKLKTRQHSSLFTKTFFYQSSWYHIAEILLWKERSPAHNLYLTFCLISLNSIHCFETVYFFISASLSVLPLLCCSCSIFFPPPLCQHSSLFVRLCAVFANRNNTACRFLGCALRL